MPRYETSDLVSRWAKRIADTDNAKAEAQRTGRILYALMEQGYLTQESYIRHKISFFSVQLCCNFLDDSVRIEKGKEIEAWYFYFLADYQREVA